MVDLRAFGVTKGEGRHHEESIYSLALLYNILFDEISSYLKKYNLTIGKFNILMAIKHQGGKDGIRQVDISKHLIVTPSNMTKMIDKLEKEKLVSRDALAGDRRVNIIKITTRGSDLMDSIWPGYNKKFKEAMASLPAENQKKLAHLLMEWLEGIA